MVSQEQGKTLKLGANRGPWHSPPATCVPATEQIQIQIKIQMQMQMQMQMQIQIQIQMQMQMQYKYNNGWRLHLMWSFTIFRAGQNLCVSVSLPNLFVSMATFIKFISRQRMESFRSKLVGRVKICMGCLIGRPWVTRGHLSSPHLHDGRARI